MGASYARRRTFVAVLVSTAQNPEISYIFRLDFRTSYTMASKFQIPRRYMILLTHLSLWVVFLSLPILLKPGGRPPGAGGGGPRPPEEMWQWLNLGMNVCLIVFFYFNYLWLLPRYYLRKSAGVYLFSVVLAYIGFQGMMEVVRMIVLYKFGPLANHERFTQMNYFISTSFFLLMWGASSGFRLGEEWRRTENLRRETERARLEAELNLLKSQINPHFLLNTLNNLYALAITTPEKTPDALLKLSDMVRYILYECAQPRVPLAHDLLFVRNYIALQQIRLPQNVTLDIDLPEAEAAPGEIEPMILIPFIENAFKHGVSTRQPCTIRVRIAADQRGLLLEVDNDFIQKTTAGAPQESGIGLSNTRQRLEHGYAGKYRLEIGRKGDKHHVQLHLQW
jgi:two-component system, LytTR family, sensor kinase